jgi:NADH-quinone oxidoreductase subunit A
MARRLKARRPTDTGTLHTGGSLADMLSQYIPILLLFIIAVGVGGGILLLTHLTGPRKPNPIKLSPYESGVPPQGDARLRFSVKFYLIAMLFILFDIEVVFLYPWAVVFKELLADGVSVLTWVLVFLGVLELGLLYLWRKGGLEWD